MSKELGILHARGLILDSYRTAQNIINNLFAVPPFAINDSDGKYHQIVLEIKSLTSAVTHIDAKIT